MAKDQLGLTLAGSADSARALDRAVADYWALTGDPVGVLKQALHNDPAFVLGAAAIAGFFLVGGFRGDHPEVMGAIAAAERALPHASDRERLHLEAVKAWADGRSIDATLAWEAILVDWPLDALALRFVADAYFFLGQSAAIRDSVARVLPAWDRAHPLAGFVLGAYAFGLEETGALGRAEETAREALALNPTDSWATHALAHVLETRGSVEEGIAFLTATRTDWSAARFMAGHNGWHLALFLIEQGRLAEVLAGYDRFTAPRLADDMTLDRCDAAALLWRLELEGADVGDRWGPVARAWGPHANDHTLAFNDLHTALAAARSPDPDDAPRFIRSLEFLRARGARPQPHGDRRSRPPPRRGHDSLRRRTRRSGDRGDPAGALRGPPDRRQPRPARHREPDADRGGGAVGAMEARPRPDRRARSRPPDREGSRTL